MPDELGRLTLHDLAFGLGRKATKEVLDELTSRPKDETFNAETVYNIIAKKLEEKTTLTLLEINKES